MELIWFEDFLELCRTGNFSRAAESRNVTQPAFSRRIRALEEWLGVSVFDRATQPVTLTRAGVELQPLAAALIRRTQETREQVRAAAAGEAATLRFAVTHALSQIFFPGWLRRLEQPGQGWTVHLSSDTLQAVETLLLEGRVQFLMCHRHAAAPPRLPADAFLSVAVADDLLLPCAAPGLLAGATGDAAVAEAPLLAYSTGSGLGRILRAVLGPRLPRLLAVPVLVADLAGSLRAACLDGGGLAWLPRSLVEADLAAGRLAVTGGEAWAVPVAVRLFRPRAPLPPAAEAFWRALASPSVRG